MADVGAEIVRVKGDIASVKAKIDELYLELEGAPPGKQAAVESRMKWLKEVWLQSHQELKELHEEKILLIQNLRRSEELHLARERFCKLLNECHVPRPDAEVMDTIERVYTLRMVACSSAAMAVDLYDLVKTIPGATTRGHFLEQHGLRVNGPLDPQRTPSVLIASTSTGCPSILKLMGAVAKHGEYTGEAAAFTAITADVPDSVALVSGKLLELDLTLKTYHGTGHPPGTYAALLMPRYIQSAASAMDLPPTVILQEGTRMVHAVSVIHAKGYVHMDIKGDNMFIDHEGKWFLGDFGSAVLIGSPVTSTSQVFGPLPNMIGQPAKPQFDWHMLAVALVVELNKSTWMELLTENDMFAPPGKLVTAIGAVQDPALKALLEDVQQRSALP